MEQGRTHRVRPPDTNKEQALPATEVNKHPFMGAYERVVSFFRVFFEEVVPH